MAKRRTTRKKKDEIKSWKPELNDGVGKDILAIVFAALAILLILAAFHFGGSMVSAAFTGLRLGLGYATYLLPIVFGILKSWESY